MKTYEYFVSYAYETGFGNGNINLKKYIEKYEDIEEIQEYINKTVGYKNAIILNYILLKEKEDQNG